MSVYILGGKRTAQGSFLGSLANVKATQLGATAIRGALEISKINSSEIEQVYMGQVLQAGVGQAPARQAAIAAGISWQAPCVTMNKVCGSGLQAIVSAAQSIMTTGTHLAVAGGMENMSLAPHYMSLRQGHKYGNIDFKDSMQMDGLWDSFTDQSMGLCAEKSAQEFKISREEQDAFAINSFKKSQLAWEKNYFESEIEPVKIQTKGSEILITKDEGPFKADFSKIPHLKPAFKKDGTITAANASTINDGACALIIASEKYASQAEFKILGWAHYAQYCEDFASAPVGAIEKNLRDCKLTLNQIDLFEINEAFALVPLIAMKQLGIAPEKVNIYGGGVSLGHPIGASGARVVLTLMNALKRENKKLGLATLCIGGGEALSIIIERL